MSSLRLRLLALANLLAVIAVAPSASFAACTGPAGNAGDIAYSATQNVLAYCNGSGWIAMGSSSTTGFGTLTTNDFCIATNNATITCNVASTGTSNVVLSASPTLTGTVSGANSTWTQIAVGTTTLNGAANINGTVTATLFSGSGASLTSIGTTNLSGITGAASSATYLRGDGTWSAASGGISAVTTVTCSASTSCTATCSAGYFRTGCSLGVATSGYAMPSGTNACACQVVTGNATCYAYCSK
ncbi:MAG: hypothetical protein JSR78_07825 [Proteobacteria bacterium]|nr:hypothetical protein [Pseudomonadota bacterium]